MVLKYEDLMGKLMEICEEIVSESIAVTDGYRTSAIVLDKKIADFLCKEMKKKYNSDQWKSLTIPNAIEYAFLCGRESILLEQEQIKQIDQPVDVSIIQGEVGGKENT